MFEAVEAGHESGAVNAEGAVDVDGLVLGVGDDGEELPDAFGRGRLAGVDGEPKIFEARGLCLFRVVMRLLVAEVDDGPDAYFFQGREIGPGIGAAIQPARIWRIWGSGLHLKYKNHSVL